MVIFRNIQKLRLEIKRVAYTLQHSIIRRLLAVVFSIYLIVTASVTLLHMDFEYELSKHTASNALKNIQAMVEDSISQAIWELNNSQLDTILKGLFSNQYIVGIKLDIPQNQAVKAVHSVELGVVPNVEGGLKFIDPQTKQITAIPSTFERLIPRDFNITYKDKLGRKLFGLSIEEETDFPKWHETVRMFKVLDGHNNLRGHFYIDLYTREGKRGGAWMAECLSRIRFASNLLQTPVAYLNCNFAKPVPHKPGLLTHQDVVTLFHEFGHTLHHILTQIDYYSVSGLNGVAWDAVELPSQFMENWAWEWQVIQDISENINTGEPMPKPLFERLLASKNFHAGMFLLRQLEYALFDLRIHEQAGKDLGRTAHDIMQDVRKEVGVTPDSAVNRFENSFSHIFAGGYAAGYYSYLWAEVLSCDAFAKFANTGLFNSTAGKDFLTKILERGGSEPAMDLFVAFAGREPQIEALLQHHAII